MKNILAINGSASYNSSNLHLLQHIAARSAAECNFTFIDQLSVLPHFNPELSVENTPAKIIEVRQQVEAADAVIICTPEYVYSIPSGLKNFIEWCVSTTVFSDKRVGLITAAADGKKGHEELQLLMRTLQASFTPATTLLVPGVKGKMDAAGNIVNSTLEADLTSFIEALLTNE